MTVTETSPDKGPVIQVDRLTMAYGDHVIQKDLSFTVNRGDIFVVMGGSGCGKSTLLLHMIGLIKPAAGRIYYGDRDLWAADSEEKQALLRKFGVLFQSGALFSSLTLAENVALPLNEFTRLSKREVSSIVSYKLALVGLAGFESYYPSEISGGMQKRAGLARAMAMDPEILYFDEPSAGLDPISARLLDDLIESLRDALGATIVIVTHELASIFAIGTNSIFLDPDSKTVIARGNPNDLLRGSADPRVLRFLTRDNSASSRSIGGSPP
jgi:phospholipid/cholesterol/gamma-HCH transport system ATP-binding protein